MRLFAFALALLALPVAAQSAHSHDDGHDHAAEDAPLGAGRATFEAEAHNFGTFHEGEPAVHAFRFTNTGSEPVTIAEVRTSCGCTTPSYTTVPVAPGGVGEIQVAYESTGRPGAFDRTATVTLAGADRRTVTLRITGTAVPDFTAGGVPQGSVTFDADLWDAAQVAPGATIRHAFQFMNNGTAPLRVRAVRTTPAEGVEVMAPDQPIFAGEIGTIIVTVADVNAIARPNGRFEVALSVETTDAEQPVKSLLIRGRVASASADVSVN